ncbi:hypothetical protein ACHAW6_007828 [Cyclotella cf. meneghiniana]
MLSWPILITHRNLRSILIVLSFNFELPLLKTTGHLCFEPQSELSTVKIQRDRTRTTGHSGNTKRVQWHAIGLNHHSLCRP